MTTLLSSETLPESDSVAYKFIPVIFDLDGKMQKGFRLSSRIRNRTSKTRRRREPRPILSADDALKRYYKRLDFKFTKPRKLTELYTLDEIACIPSVSADNTQKQYTAGFGEVISIALPKNGDTSTNSDDINQDSSLVCTENMYSDEFQYALMAAKIDLMTTKFTLPQIETLLKGYNNVVFQFDPTVDDPNIDKSKVDPTYVDRVHVHRVFDIVKEGKCYVRLS